MKIVVENITMPFSVISTLSDIVDSVYSGGISKEDVIFKAKDGQMIVFSMDRFSCPSEQLIPYMKGERIAEWVKENHLFGQLDSVVAFFTTAHPKRGGYYELSGPPGIFSLTPTTGNLASWYLDIGFGYFDGIKKATGIEVIEDVPVQLILGKVDGIFTVGAYRYFAKASDVKVSHNKHGDWTKPLGYTQDIGGRKVFLANPYVMYERGYIISCLEIDVFSDTGEKTATIPAFFGLNDTDIELYRRLFASDTRTSHPLPPTPIEIVYAPFNTPKP